MNENDATIKNLELLVDAANKNTDSLDREKAGIHAVRVALRRAKKNPHWVLMEMASDEVECYLKKIEVVKNTPYRYWRRTYRFENHHNGATRSRTIVVKSRRSVPIDEAYLSGDNLRRSDFGNGWTTMTEKPVGDDYVPTGEEPVVGPIITGISQEKKQCYES